MENFRKDISQNFYFNEGIYVSKIIDEVENIYAGKEIKLYNTPEESLFIKKVDNKFVFTHVYKNNIVDIFEEEIPFMINILYSLLTEKTESEKREFIKNYKKQEKLNYKRLRENYSKLLLCLEKRIKLKKGWLVIEYHKDKIVFKTGYLETKTYYNPERVEWSKPRDEDYSPVTIVNEIKPWRVKEIKLPPDFRDKIKKRYLTLLALKHKCRKYEDELAKNIEYVEYE